MGLLFGYYVRKKYPSLIKHGYGKLSAFSSIAFHCPSYKPLFLKIFQLAMFVATVFSNSHGLSQALGSAVSALFDDPSGWKTLSSVGKLFLREEHLYKLVGGFKHLLFSIIYGMSSFPLTNSIIFQDGEIAPPTSIYSHDISMIFP